MFVWNSISIVDFVLVREKTVEFWFSNVPVQCRQECRNSPIFITNEAST